MDEKSEGAVELRCQASSLSNGSGLRNFISESELTYIPSSYYRVVSRT